MPISQPAIDFQFYEDARAAETEFHLACIKQFGASDAASMRYIPARFNEETKQAYDKKLACDLLWKKELERSAGQSSVYEYSYYDW